MNSIRFLKDKLNLNFSPQGNDSETYVVQEIEETKNENLEVDINNDTDNTPSIIETEDDLSANLLSSAFAIIEERRKISHIVSKYKEQIYDSKAIISDILVEKDQFAKSLEEREKQLTTVQVQLTDQQEKYHELMEEQKLLRVNELKERKRLQQQIKELQADYEALMIEFKQFQEDANREIIAHKDAIREGKEKYSHLLLQHNKVSEDNKALMEKIGNFTKQISFVQMLNTDLLNNNEAADSDNSQSEDL